MIGNEGPGHARGEIKEVGGQLLNLGIAKEARNTIFYNKDMFAKAGITTLPKTYTEFEAACEKLKAAGFTPMITDGGSGASWVAGDALNILSDTLKLDVYDQKVKQRDQLEDPLVRANRAEGAAAEAVRPVSPDELRSYQKPTLILWGKDDHGNPIEPAIDDRVAVLRVAAG